MIFWISVAVVPPSLIIGIVPMDHSILLSVQNNDQTTEPNNSYHIEHPKFCQMNLL